MSNPEANSPHGSWSGYLSELEALALDAHSEHILQTADQGNAGSAMWQGWKRSGLRDGLALAQASGRMRIQVADLTGPLRLVFDLRVTVPTLPKLNGDLVVEDVATLGLTYPEEALREALPGYAFMMLLAPAGLWLPNAAPALGPEAPHLGPQVICLAPTVSPRTSIRELILRTYGALTMQSVQLDPRAAEGVLNPQASAWWQANTSRIPLSREGFLKSPQPPQV